MTTSAITIPEQSTGGVISQTTAIFYDAYRELNARKMFWGVLILSVIAIGAFATVAVTPHGMKILSYQIDTGFVPAKSLYKSQFSFWMISLWLSWAATILAIISTASIFPDFLTSGSIDLFLAKPISRLRLFFTKYLAGMLFVFLQVAAFAVIAFFVVGVRGQMWEPRLFLIIPVVLCFFSYLFAVSVFFGVLMRSTLAALLFTILLWLLVFLVHFSEVRLQAAINVSQQEIADIDDSLRDLNESHPTTAATTKQSHGLMSSFSASLSMLGLNDQRRQLMEQRDQETSNLHLLSFWHKLIFPVQVVVPKTSETIAMLNDQLLSRDEFQTIMQGEQNRAIENHRGRRAARLDIEDEIDQITRARSWWWVIGSSLCFEAFVILLAGWLFCRRDY